MPNFRSCVARWADGRTAFWDSPIENVHRDGILRRSNVPASDVVAAQVRTKPQSLAIQIAEALGHVGVLTVEFFATKRRSAVNEIAPRVHNSGHWTIEGAATSQFEQHIRAICGLPPGSTALLAPSVTMDNLIGDEVDRWPELVAEPGAHVHLYGKGEARPGRKMGHVTRLIDYGPNAAASPRSACAACRAAASTLAASPTTTQTKPLGSSAPRSAAFDVAVVCARYLSPSSS